jgi:CheY-like chemotaxis protein
MSNPIRILIADDHPIFRHGLRQIIEQAPQLVVVEEAEDGETAWRKLLAGGVEVAVLDIDMPDRDGFEIARAIRGNVNSSRLGQRFPTGSSFVSAALKLDKSLPSATPISYSPAPKRTGSRRNWVSGFARK